MLASHRFDATPTSLQICSDRPSFERLLIPIVFPLHPTKHGPVAIIRVSGVSGGEDLWQGMKWSTDLTEVVPRITAKGHEAQAVEQDPFPGNNKNSSIAVSCLVDKY